ncbi:MAG: hypothetical protein ACYCV7_11780 [Acidimicrobiales bacterium]
MSSGDDTEVVAGQLVTISERLADLALGRLRHALEAAPDGEPPDPALVSEEKRITRARRAVDKAVQLLGGPVS